jgi:parallel beta helix pectate lyase-like protein
MGGADGESIASLEITFNDIHLSSQMSKSAFGIHANRLRRLLVYGNTITHFGDGGIELVGVSDSTICFNRSVDQSTASKGNGIQVEQWNPSMTSANNRIENNTVD